MASQGNVSVGSIYGISIELNWFFILMILLFYIIGGWLFALIWILLFVCVLIHELAHSVTALRNKVKVSRIVLLPFGGASVIENNKIDPKVEFRISVVGPLMSLFLGGVFGILAIIFPPGIIQQLCQTLFILNVFLGVFNIIPAFPMDGGRIFRSYLEKKYNLYDATMITAKLTKIILLAIVAISVYILTLNSYSIFYREYVFFIDMIVVAFIYMGMKAEEDMVTLRKNTVGLKIGSAVSKHYAFIKSDAEVSDLYKVVKDTGEHTLITKTDSGYAVVDLRNRGKVMNAGKISDIALAVPKVNANASVVDGISALSNSDYGLVVVERIGRPIGIITYQQVQSYISLHLMEKDKAKRNE